MEEQQLFDTLKPFEQRLVEEYRDLDAKTKKLEKFIDTDNPTYYTLALAEQTDLVTQLHAMIIYRLALSNRLSRKGLLEKFFPLAEQG